MKPHHSRITQALSFNESRKSPDVYSDHSLGIQRWESSRSIARAAEALLDLPIQSRAEDDGRRSKFAILSPHCRWWMSCALHCIQVRRGFSNVFRLSIMGQTPSPSPSRCANFARAHGRAQLVEADLDRASKSSAVAVAARLGSGRDTLEDAPDRVAASATLDLV